MNTILRLICKIWTILWHKHFEFFCVIRRMDKMLFGECSFWSKVIAPDWLEGKFLLFKCLFNPWLCLPFHQGRRDIQRNVTQPNDTQLHELNDDTQLTLFSQWCRASLRLASKWSVLLCPVSLCRVSPCCVSWHPSGANLAWRVSY